jgi:hypothetical protein
MTARPVPRRHWRSYGNDPLPTSAEAISEPISAFPSWYLRITCDRCGKDRMMNEVHTAQRDLPIREIIKRARHDGCGGRAGKVELLTGIDGSSRPVRKIVLRAD